MNIPKEPKGNHIISLPIAFFFYCYCCCNGWGLCTSQSGFLLDVTYQIGKSLHTQSWCLPEILFREAMLTLFAGTALNCAVFHEWKFYWIHIQCDTNPPRLKDSHQRQWPKPKNTVTYLWYFPLGCGFIITNYSTRIVLNSTTRITVSCSIVVNKAEGISPHHSGKIINKIQTGKLNNYFLWKNSISHLCSFFFTSFHRFYCVELSSTRDSINLCVIYVHRQNLDLYL